MTRHVSYAKQELLEPYCSRADKFSPCFFFFFFFFCGVRIAQFIFFCVVFCLFVSVLCLVSLDCPPLITFSFFSNVNIIYVKHYSLDMSESLFKKVWGLFAFLIETILKEAPPSSTLIQHLFGYLLYSSICNYFCRIRAILDNLENITKSWQIKKTHFWYTLAYY